MSSQAIAIHNLSRNYTIKKGILKKTGKCIQALKNISFEVNAGELFSLLGPNGAGKTTMIKILTTLLLPTDGSATMFGYDVVKHPKKIQNRINFVFGGERSLYWRLTAMQNLHYFSDLKCIPYQTQCQVIEKSLELVGLADRKDDKVETFSKGMKQRLQLARGLLNDPDILFLDEPTIGLDPIGARDFRNLIRELQGLGKTIFLTTHYMPEADELSDRIAMINKGEIVDIDTPARLKAKYCGFKVVEFHILGLEENLSTELHSYPEVLHISTKTMDFWQIVEIKTLDEHTLLQRIEHLKTRYNIKNLHYRDGSLEDAYINLIEKKD